MVTKNLIFSFNLLFALYIFVSVNLVLVRPINSLNRQIKNIDYEKKHIIHTAKNEIGSIGAHINEMLDKISSLNRNNIESQARLYEREVQLLFLL